MARTLPMSPRGEVTDAFRAAIPDLEAALSAAINAALQNAAPDALGSYAGDYLFEKHGYVGPKVAAPVTHSEGACEVDLASLEEKLTMLLGTTLVKQIKGVCMCSQ